MVSAEVGDFDPLIHLSALAVGKNVTLRRVSVFASTTGLSTSECQTFMSPQYARVMAGALLAAAAKAEKRAGHAALEKPAA